MSTKQLCFLLLFLWSYSTVCSAAALIPGRTSFNTYPIAYNLHKSFNPKDINDLEPAHVQKAIIDVSSTISEIEHLLVTDPKLPRLTRGEITELFENVTKDEYEQSLRAGDTERAKHMRALMIVLPYNAENVTDNQMLYRRLPVNKQAKANLTPGNQVQSILKTPEFNLNNPTETFHAKEPTTYKPYLSKFNMPAYNPTNSFPMSPELKIEDSQFSDNNEYSHNYKSIAKPDKLFNSDYNEDLQSQFSTNYEQKELSPDLQKIKKLFEKYDTENAVPKKSLSTMISVAPSVNSPEISPELEDLLQSFGLLNNNDQQKNNMVNPQEEFHSIDSPIFNSMQSDSHLSIDESVITQSIKKNSVRQLSSSEPITKDFSSFKPLPIPDDLPVNQLTPEMEEFFKSFGLLDDNSQNRRRKSMEQKEEISNKESDFVITTINPIITDQQVTTGEMNNLPEVNVDFLTNDFMNVLGKIGIPIDQTSTLAPPINSDVKTSTASSIQVTDYNPLHNVLDTIKRLEELNNEEENKFKKSNDEYDVNDFDKNEVKRQIVTDDEISQNDSSSENPIRFTLDLQGTTEHSVPLINMNVAPNDVRINNIEKDKDVVTDNNVTSNDGIKGGNNEERLTTIENESVTTEVDENLFPTEIDNELNLSKDTTILTSTTSEPDLLSGEKEASTSRTTITDQPRKTNLDLTISVGGDDGGLDPVTENPLPPPRRNGFYFLADWNSFLEVGDDPDKVVVRFDPKIGDPSQFVPVKF